MHSYLHWLFIQVFLNKVKSWRFAEIIFLQRDDLSRGSVCNSDFSYSRMWNVPSGNDFLCHLFLFFFFFGGWENSIGAGHSDVSSPYLSAPAGPRGRHPGARQAEQVKKSYSHVFTCIQGSIEMQEKLFIYMHYSSSYTLLLVLIDCLI